jgi:hypothetical protein
MVEWMFYKMWRYTVLTFHILGWLVRATSLLATAVLNRRQRKPPSGKDDLFNQGQKG